MQYIFDILYSIELEGNYRITGGGLIRLHLLTLRVNQISPVATQASLPSPDQDVVEAVVEAVADAESTSPLELEPLATAIDPEALATAVESMDAWHDDESGTVTFAYSGYRVAVTGECDVSLTGLDGTN